MQLIAWLNAGDVLGALPMTDEPAAVDSTTAA